MPKANTASDTSNKEAVSAKSTAQSQSSPTPQTRTAQVLALLARSGGVTMDELVAATSWQPHTARAALTGLRKKGHAITREKVDGVSRYRLEEAGQ